MEYTSNYNMLLNEKSKGLYKQFIGRKFSELTANERKELYKNGYCVSAKTGREYTDCIIEFSCGLSLDGLYVFNNSKIGHIVPADSILIDDFKYISE